MGVVFPPLYDEAPCYVVAINREFVPYVAGMLQIMEKQGFWASDSDYRRGYNAVVEMEACFMATCLNDLLERQDALYRLVNSGIYGQVYTVVGVDPLVVEPPIEPRVDPAVFERASLMGKLDEMIQLVDNSINGTETPLYTYEPSVKTLLQGIIDALGEEETDLADLLAQLELIVGLLG